MTGNAIYRFPYASTCQYVCGETVEVGSVADLDGYDGFAVAPFEPAPQRPVCVIKPERYWQDVPIYELASRLPLLDQTLMAGCRTVEPEGEGGTEADYARDFARFKEQLQTGRFQKLVLARAQDVISPSGRVLSPLSLFQKACSRYPRLFVALCFTPRSGLWLVASPEVLLQGGPGGWLTTALAGTMRLEGDQLSQERPQVEWSAKNRQEQQYVAAYISNCLKAFATEVEERGPYTVRAADLAHLRTDFMFRLPPAEGIGRLLQALHPTPAVCGLPKDEAFSFILQGEHTPRSYYSGFMGPLGLPTADGQDAVTRLFVSLRCMRIFPRYCQLYAGGGLLPESQEEQEWGETVAKMSTMYRLLYP